jgi:hypothetical protein
VPEDDRPTSAADQPGVGLLADWLRLQQRLQSESFDVDPPNLEGESRTTYLLWNAYALIDEVGEAMDNVGWKPWASSDHFNREMFVKELVDALHFLGNMLLTAGVTGDELWRLYREKVKVNAERQRVGYTGLEKCPACGNALDDSDCTTDACTSGGDVC